MEVLRFFEDIRNPVLTGIFELFTLAGDEIVILAVLCFLFWCVNKKMAYQICFVYFISGLAVQALKITFRIPRPWVKDPALQTVPSALETATGYSFPSGHTQSGAALYGTLAFLTKKIGLQILFVAISVGVGISRMYLGVHTPADVATAILLSYAVIFLINRLFKTGVIEKKMLHTSIIMVLISVAVMVYSFTLLSMGKITEEYVSDCCKAAGAGLAFAIGWYIENKYICFHEKCGSVMQQIVKFLIGAGIALCLKVGLKELIGSSIPADTVRYFILVFWVIVCYPLIIKKFFKQKKMK